MERRPGRERTERDRFPDELEDEETEDSEEATPPEPQKPAPAAWPQWLSIAASLAAVTAIGLLTLEMSMDTIRLGKLAAYAMGSSLLIGALLLLIIGIKRVLPRFKPGLSRYAFWFVAIPIGFIYYLGFVFLIYSQFAPLLIKFMTAAMDKAP